MNATQSRWVVIGPLRLAGAVYAGAFGLHNLDHLRRGIGSLNPEVLFGGTVAGVVSIGLLMPVFTRHRWAPAAAAVAGFALTAAFSAAHLAPEWGRFSDSFVSAPVDVLSSAGVLLKVGGSLLLGIAGAVTLQRTAVGARPS
jgi:hypothetical protein